MEHTSSTRIRLGGHLVTVADAARLDDGAGGRSDVEVASAQATSPTANVVSDSAASTAVPAGVETVQALAGVLSPREVLEFADRLRSFAEALSAEGVMRLFAATDVALAMDLQEVADSSPGMAVSVGSGTLAADAVSQVVAQEVAAVRGIARMTAAHEVNRSRLLVNDSPEVFEALATGGVGVRHAQEIADLGLRIEPEFVPAPESDDPVAREEYERALMQAEIECGQRRGAFCRDTLEKSAGKTPGQVRRHGKRRLEQELPEAFETRHRNARAGRDVTAQESEDGMSYLTAYIPTAAAEAIERRLTEYARAIKHPAAEDNGQAVDLFIAQGASKWAEARDEQRSLGEIRADAFVDMLLSGPEASGLANVKPHITVTVPAPLLMALGASLPENAGLAADTPSTAEGRIAPEDRTTVENQNPRKKQSAGQNPGDGAGAFTDGSKLGAGGLGASVPTSSARTTGMGMGTGVLKGTMSGGGVPAAAGVDAEVLMRFAGLFTGAGTVEAERLGAMSLTDLRAVLPQAASWTRVITDPWTGAISHFDPKAYTVPAALRRAVALRDRTCRIPGCSRRASECEPDHVIEYQHGGETRLENLVSLCKRCHRLKSWGLLTLELSETGVLDVETFWGTRRITLPDAPWEVGTHQRKTPQKILRNRTVKVPVPEDTNLPNADLFLHGLGIMDEPFPLDEPPRELTAEERQDVERAVEKLEQALRDEIHPPF